MAINFKLVSEFQTIHRRSFELADTTILNPNNANPLIDGEWLQLDGNYKMARGTGPGGAAEPSYCYFGEQGRYETQAIGKGPFLYMGEYEADTKVFDSSGLSTTVVGEAMMVDDVTYGALTRKGLKLASSTNYIVGRTTRLSASNNGFLRFRTVNG